jgi:hypothetical protein
VTGLTEDLGGTTRRYQGGRLRFGARLVCYGYGLVPFAALAGAAAGGAPWVLVPASMLFIAWILWFELRVVPSGMDLGPRGLVVVTPYRRRAIPLSEVQGFDLRTGRPGTRVVSVVLVDGSAVRADGVQIVDSGPLKYDWIRWDGGQSSDVVGTLERHLAALRGD